MSQSFWRLGQGYLLQKKVPQDLTFKVLRYTEYATSRSGEAIPVPHLLLCSSVFFFVFLLFKGTLRLNHGLAPLLKVLWGCLKVLHTCLRLRNPPSPPIVSCFGLSGASHHDPHAAHEAAAERAQVRDALRSLDVEE